MSARPVTLDVRLDAAAMRAALERDARTGLLSSPKTLPPVWFYDDVGSELFDEITRLAEYYPTRAERALLVAHAKDIAEAIGAVTLVELGAGTCTKTRILLDALTAAGTLRRYVAVDVAEGTLVAATEQIASEYPELEVDATIADFHHLEGLMAFEGPILVAFLGGTIGNLEPQERFRFLVGLDAELAHADGLLLGTDLVKDRQRLLAAYDDASGVTAAFNRNVLAVLNRELGADFDPTAFEHVVRFDEDHQWIEMRLRASSAQKVRLTGLGIELSFEEGEELRPRSPPSSPPTGSPRSSTAPASSSITSTTRRPASSCSPSRTPTARRPHGALASSFERGLDGTVERRVRVDHVPKALGRHLGVHGEGKNPSTSPPHGPADVAPTRTPRSGVLHELDEAVVAGLVDPSPRRLGHG